MWDAELHQGLELRLKGVSSPWGGWDWNCVCPIWKVIHNPEINECSERSSTYRLYLRCTLFILRNKRQMRVGKKKWKAPTFHIVVFLNFIFLSDKTCFPHKDGSEAPGHRSCYKGQWCVLTWMGALQTVKTACLKMTSKGRLHKNFSSGPQPKRMQGQLLSCIMTVFFAHSLNYILLEERNE